MLSTSEFAHALGVSESSVRRMADSGELEIHRTRGGHRRIPIPEAVRYLRENDIKILRPELLGLSEDASDLDQQTAEDRMLTVLRDGEATTVVSLMQSLYATGMSVAQLCDGPISKALATIGEAWPHDRRSIFIEHRAVVLAARGLSQLHGSIGQPDPDAPDAIGGAISGDNYLLPTLMASLVLHEIGFNEVNLGPNIPLDVLADCVQYEKPKLLWLSISRPISSRTQAYELIKLAEAARDQNTSFIIGGRYSRGAAVYQPNDQSLWTNCDSMSDLARETLRLI